MKRLFALSLLGAYHVAMAFGQFTALNGWEILPQPGEWKILLASFNNPTEVNEYVAIYARPFYELQLAERNVNISSTMIKASFIAVLDLVIEACGAFNLTETTLMRRHRVEYRRALESATECFSSTRASQLQPVFLNSTIRSFVFQRFNDMMIVSRSYEDWLKLRNDYGNLLKQWRAYVEELKADYFKMMVPRNLEFAAITNYTATTLSKHLNKTMDREDIEDLKWHIYSLGNEASAAAHKGYFGILPITLLFGFLLLL